MKRTFSAPMYIVSGFLILFLSSFTATALPHPFIRPKSASFTEQQITPTSDETLAARCAQRQYLPCFAEVSGQLEKRPQCQEQLGGFKSRYRRVPP